MTRAYIRLDPAFDERKESYPDGPYAALIGCFCLGEAQPHRGRFRSLDYLKRLLGKRGRHVAYLLDHKDIVVQKDGRVYIDGWDEWQEGDVTVRERVQRLRTRRSNAARNGLGNGDTVPPLKRTPSEVSGAMSGAIAVTPDRAAGLSQEDEREHLDKLADVLKANGVMPGKPHPTPSETEPEYVARLQRVADDPEEVAWKRDAAKAQLEAMRVTS